jgi:hypothetical protein
MKNKIAIFSFLIAAVALSACQGHYTKYRVEDTAKAQHATNPYRDTFPTTHTYGNATTEDNSGSGGTAIIKPLQGAKADSAKAK